MNYEDDLNARDSQSEARKSLEECYREYKTDFLNDIKDDLSISIEEIKNNLINSRKDIYASLKNYFGSFYYSESDIGSLRDFENVCDRYGELTGTIGKLIARKFYKEEA